MGCDAAADPGIVAIMEDYADTTGGLYIEAAGDGADIAAQLTAAIDPCPDCNGNGVSDPLDVALGTSPDCNANGRPDECELPGNDCNANGVLDDCETVGENHVPVIFVDRDATAGANDGLSWADAFTSLQDALAFAPTYAGYNATSGGTHRWHGQHGGGVVIPSGRSMTSGEQDRASRVSLCLQ